MLGPEGTLRKLLANKIKERTIRFYPKRPLFFIRGGETMHRKRVAWGILKFCKSEPTAHSFFRNFKNANIKNELFFTENMSKKVKNLVKKNIVFNGFPN